MAISFMGLAGADVSAIEKSPNLYANEVLNTETRLLYARDIISRMKFEQKLGKSILGPILNDYFSCVS